MYTDGEYTESYAEDSNNVATVSNGGDGASSGANVTRRSNGMIAFFAALAVASLVGVFLMKKNVSERAKINVGIHHE